MVEPEKIAAPISKTITLRMRRSSFSSLLRRRLIGEDGAVRFRHPRDDDRFGVPSFAGLMSTVTVSPSLRELRDQPARQQHARRAPLGDPLHLAAFAIVHHHIHQVCGLTHWNSLTTPVIVMTFVTSNATLLWCDRAGAAAKRTAANVTDAMALSDHRCLLHFPTMCGRSLLFSSQMLSISSVSGSSVHDSLHVPRLRVGLRIVDRHVDVDAPDGRAG